MDGNRNIPGPDKNAHTREVPVQKSANPESQTRQIPAQKPAAPQVRQVPTRKPAEPASQTRTMPVQKPVAPAPQARQNPMQKSAEPASQTRTMPVQKPSAPAPQARQNPVQNSAEPVKKTSVPPTANSDTTTAPVVKKPADMAQTKQMHPVADSNAAPDNGGTKVMNPLSESITPPKKKVRREKSEDTDGSTIISIVKAVVYLVSVLVVSVAISLFVILVGNDVFAFVKSDEVVSVTIPEDANLSDIATILADNGIIKYPSIFEWYSDDDDGEFVAGSYDIACNQDYEDLLNCFKKQVDKGTSWITIPEGFTTDEVINLLVESGIGTKEGYIDVINNYPYDYWFVHELDETDWKSNGRFYRLDGYLFPDTYEFYNDSTEKTVIDKLLARFNVIYGKKYREATETMGMSCDEIVIIASMIEKEAGQPSDVHLISSVFHNRLKSAYYPKLESDATAIYAIHHDTGERPTDVTGEHMQYDSPYNTYLYDGLPPGPISNPSASAINAALTPEITEYYYFVSYGNTTLYGRTNNEHENNKAIIREMKNQASGNTQG